MGGAVGCKGLKGENGVKKEVVKNFFVSVVKKVAKFTNKNI
jgi:hypothetical protein